MDVKYKVAIVRDHGASLALGHAQHGASAKALERVHERHIGHRYDLDGHTLRPLLAKFDRFFSVVGDDHKALGGKGHDLLLQLAAAAALDAVELQIHFVGAVNRDIDDRVLVQTRERELVLRNELWQAMVSRDDTERRRDGRTNLLGLEGRGDALDVELLLAHELAQTLSRVHDRGAAAHAHDGAVRYVLIHGLARRLHHQDTEREGRCRCK